MKANMKLKTRLIKTMKIQKNRNYCQALRINSSASSIEILIIKMLNQKT